uniref:WRKY19-like zinc finger domain-containing protein n=1 Tax=Phytophthora ramorum TaxID=164328 RepID=H3H2T4_PHYRM
MDVRDKLTLAHPETTLSDPRSVITPSALPVVGSFRNFATGLTVSPASRIATSSIMHQQPISTTYEDAKDKAALSFILSSSDSESEPDESGSNTRGPTTGTSVIKRKRPAATRTSEVAAPARKGSKFCTVEGCTSRAKHAKRCWKHGGSVKCKVPDCINRAKSKGVCWSHGGGTVCSFESCDTIAVSNGFCWAHGGGKRCQVANCSKPAYERTQNYCQTHYEELGAAGTGES